MKSKAFLYIPLIITIILLCSACGNKNKVTELPGDMEPTEIEPGEIYGFTELNMTIDKKELKEAILVEYKEGHDKIESVYENKIENKYLHGNKAIDKLSSMFDALDFDPTMEDLDMIKKVSEVFEIKDYKSIKLDIKFKGHDKKQLKFMK